MYRYLLIAYIVVYAVIAVGMFLLHALMVPEEEKRNDKGWETPLDVILAVVGLVGMLLFYWRVDPHWLKLAWRPVSLALAVTQVWGNLRDRLVRRRAEWDGDREAARVADLTTLLFLVPSLALNLVYAFG